MNQKQLATLLSKLKGFDKQDVKLEQYPTPSEIAASVLWKALMAGDVEGKVVADFGCGPGVFGLGAAVLGAKKVFLVDIDKEAVAVAKHNRKFLEKELKRKLNVSFLNDNLKEFSGKANTVIQNPPFGVKKSHSDKLFLLKGMETAPKIYSFHKLSTRKFIESIAKDHGYSVKEIMPFKFPLARTMWFHIKSVHFVETGCWVLAKN